MIFSNGSIGFKYEEDKMKHKQVITFGIVLVLVILPATACTSLATPKNITVTFDETCTMKGPNTISAGAARRPCRVRGSGHPTAKACRPGA